MIASRPGPGLAPRGTFLQIRTPVLTPIGTMRSVASIRLLLSLAGGNLLLPACVRAGDLTGTSWRLEDLAGRGLVQRVEATLEFTEPGFASGDGSCNRFRGPVTITGETIRFGALMSTKRACVDEAANAQETEYLAALGAAERWEIRDGLLYIHAAGRPEPLRFSRR